MQEKTGCAVLPREIYLDRNVRRTPYVEGVLANFPTLPVHIVDEPKDAVFPDDALFITNFKGSLLKTCPGTSHYICCDYWILNFATGCLLDCAYCILQTYLNAPSMLLYANIEQMRQEISHMLEGSRRKFRIGTGELTDSLLLDEKTRFSESMISYLLQFENAVVELKTKTLNLDSVRCLGPHPNLVISWSLNSPEMAALYETMSPTIKERIQAAASLEKLGFGIGIHFDPLIYTGDWEIQYTKTLDMMRDELQNLAWISLGTFRGPKGLKRAIGENHPGSALYLEEFVTGEDGKLRYFRPIRTRMYRFMKERLSRDFPDTPVYLCMESRRVWRDVFGWAPKNNRELGDWLLSR